MDNVIRFNIKTSPVVGLADGRIRIEGTFDSRGAEQMTNASVALGADFFFFKPRTTWRGIPKILPSIYATL